MSNTVSIIIPAYNQAEYLAGAIKSALGQTYNDIEVIVVNDGSTDHTEQVARTFIGEASNDRVRYIEQTNKGLSAARNAGIRAASGAYLALLDSDDALLPRKLERQVQYLQQHPQVGLVASGYHFIDEHSQVLREERPWLSSPDLGFRNWVTMQPFVPSAFLLRREWLSRVGEFDEALRADEDWDFYLRLAQAGCPMRWSEDIVCLYRIHANNMSKDPSRMKEAGLSVLHKVFAADGVTADIRDLQPIAQARVYLDAASRGYAAGFAEQARRDLERAIELDPTLLQGSPPNFLSTLASWALTPYVRNSEQFIRDVLSHLPPNTQQVRYSHRQAMGLLHAVASFECQRREERPALVKHAMRAMWYDPAWLANRGLWAIAGRAMLGVLTA